MERRRRRTPHLQLCLYYNHTHTLRYATTYTHARVSQAQVRITYTPKRCNTHAHCRVDHPTHSNGPFLWSLAPISNSAKALSFLTSI